MESPVCCSDVAPATDAGAQREEGIPALVDPFLVEALENPRHRLTGL